jgi:hypothetical protein
MAKESKDNREFRTAKDVETVVAAMDDTESLRAAQRAMVNGMFNGDSPWTKEEEAKFGIEINVNWQEGKRIMRDAIAQVKSALLHTGTLFSCSLEAGQEDKRDEWGQAFTSAIHRPIQRGKMGRKHYFVKSSQIATTCMHGVGALLWTNGFRWMPRFIPMEDLRIPTDTLCDFNNLRYFAVNVYLTPGELVDMALGETVQKGWNDKMVKQILENLRKVYQDGMPNTWRDQPEAMKQIHNENKGYFYSDAVAKIRARWFFYQEVDEPNKWYRCMILREGYGEAKPGDDFLFDGTDQPFADDICEILAIQYGDNNLVAPLKYHSVRGIGIDLFAPVQELNQLRSRFVQATHDNLMTLFRSTDPSDRAKLKAILLHDFAVLPAGLSFVKNEERNKPDSNMVSMALDQMKQITQESSSSYLQNVNDGTEKSMTAKEATIKLNQATVMVSSMLQSLYLQEGFYYEEIVRRFCKKGSADPDVKEFQTRCKKYGVPEEYLYDCKVWRVVPERVLGGGDQSQAQQEAGWLWQNSSQFDPSVQSTLKRIAVGAILRDPNKAKILVPIAKPQSTTGSIAAENCFGTLMTGNQVSPRTGIDQQGYLVKMLQMMGSVVQRITQTGGVGTIEEIIGLQTVSQNVVQSIQILSADAKQMQLVKQAGDAMGKLMNEVKAFAQRWQEQQQAKQQQGDDGASAKAKGTMMMAQTKMQIAQANAAQKQQQKAMDFALQQQMDKIKLLADIDRENLRAHHDATNEAMQNAMQLMHEARTASLKSANNSN